MGTLLGEASFEQGRFQRSVMEGRQFQVDAQALAEV